MLWTAGSQEYVVLGGVLWGVGDVGGTGRERIAAATRPGPPPLAITRSTARQGCTQVR